MKTKNNTGQTMKCRRLRRHPGMSIAAASISATGAWP